MKAYPFALSLVLAGCSPESSAPKPVTFSMEISVPAGGEITRCLVTELGNEGDFDLVKTASRMTPGSHHLIVYSDASASIGAEPPVLGLNDCTMETPRLFLYGAQTYEFETALPSGIARKLEPGTLLIIEAHYANASDAPIDARIDVTLFPATEPIENYAGILFYMDTEFSIPPQTSLFTDGTSCAIPENVNIYRLGSHTHKRGTKVEIFRNVPAATEQKIYESTDWSSPVEIVYPDSAPLRIGSGESFRFDCTWSNETDQAIGYGPSVEDEMCIVAAGYWPAVEGPFGMKGTVYCIDGTLYY